ncbi:LuxR family transcriptional regulator protein (plasmid) [Rhizobium sp. NXC14]|nr:LuxR family transcriptional regulator protein [Rhizobium sp. NXC14]
MSDSFSLVPSKAETEAVELCRFLDQTDGLARSEQLFDSLSDFALNFGCPWVAYRPLKPNHKFSTPTRCSQKAMLNYPDEWLKRYSEMDYDRIDPIINKSRKRVRAFRWSEVYSDASTTKIERLVLDEAASFGLRSGISVPMHGPESSFAVMSFAKPSEFEFDNRTITYLQLAALHFHSKVATVDSSCAVGTPSLSLREKECISWVARGKSSWDIGTILGISHNTVDFHVKNAMQKLDVTSRIVAAMKAVDFGIIEL